MQPQGFRVSRAKYARYLVTSVLFVVIGGFEWNKGSSAFERWMGIFTILFFGAGCVVFVKNLLDVRPRLVIDDSGVFDRTLGVGIIPWPEITGAYARQVAGNEFVCLRVRDPMMWTHRYSKPKQALVKVNRGLGFAELNLNLSGLSVKATLIMSLIQERIPPPAIRG